MRTTREYIRLHIYTSLGLSAHIPTIYSYSYQPSSTYFVASSFFNSANRTGFGKKISTPTDLASLLASKLASPVSAMRYVAGKLCSRSKSRICFVASSPFMTGMLMSMRTKSKRHLPTLPSGDSDSDAVSVACGTPHASLYFSMASCPFSASWYVKPHFFMNMMRSRRLIWLSSTSSTWAGAFLASLPPLSYEVDREFADSIETGVGGVGGVPTFAAFGNVPEAVVGGISRCVGWPSRTIEVIGSVSNTSGTTLWSVPESWLHADSLRCPCGLSARSFAWPRQALKALASFLGPHLERVLVQNHDHQGVRVATYG